MPLAAAAYNAGPSRSRNWRKGPVLEAAIWAENIPFTETRDYVKKVLSNTTNYAAIITGQPQSLKARLGTVGPRNAQAREENTDLP
jgi:soluble lytic murein transglycosylase